MIHCMTGHERVEMVWDMDWLCYVCPTCRRPSRLFTLENIYLAEREAAKGNGDGV